MTPSPHTTLDDQIRAKIKAWVQTTGISQRLLAERIGRTQSWMSRYLGGEIAADLDTLARIAAVFQHSLSALLETPTDPREATLVELYRGLPADARQALLALLRAVARAGHRPRR